MNVLKDFSLHFWPLCGCGRAEVRFPLMLNDGNQTALIVSIIAWLIVSCIDSSVVKNYFTGLIKLFSTFFYGSCIKRQVNILREGHKFKKKSSTCCNIKILLTILQKCWQDQNQLKITLIKTIQKIHGKQMPNSQNNFVTGPQFFVART